MKNGTMVRETIERLSAGKNLTGEETRQVFLAMMDGELTPAQVGGILVGLKAKGETEQEVTAAAEAMLSRAVTVNTGADCIDTCGTGGDGKGTLNISTMAALVVAACGVPVAKHGNRSVSSQCGSADLLECMGIPIPREPEEVKASIEDTGFGFIFAPAFHPAMRHAMGPRRELGTRTIFNILGPLVNPARPRYQMVGVFKRELMPLVGKALLALGRERVCVLHSEDGLDEVSISGETHVWFGTAQGTCREFTISPEDLNITPRPLSDISGGDAEQNAKMATEILSGKEGGGRNAVLLNAALAMYTAGREDMKENVETAAAAMDSGAVMGLVKRLRSGA